MTRDIWKQPPSGNEGDAAKDFEPAAKDETISPEEAASEAEEPRGYEPKHRAPGRAPLIRRRRSKAGDEETISWETTWTEQPKEPSPSRWTDEQEPSITPPARPIEEVPYLGPRRSEQKKRRSRPAEPPDPPARSREYTGRHLASKKPRWGRSADEPTDVEGDDGAQVTDAAMVEGDVERPLVEEPTGSKDAAPADARPLVEEPTGSKDAGRADVRPLATTERSSGNEHVSAQPARRSPAPRAPERDTPTPAEPEDVAPAARVVTSQARPEAPHQAASPAMVDEDRAPESDPVSDTDAPTASEDIAPDTEEEGGAPKRGLLRRGGWRRRRSSERVEEDDRALYAPLEEPAAEAAVEGAPEEPEVDAPEPDGSRDDAEERGADAEEDYEDAPAGPRRAALEERKKKRRVLQGGVAALAVVAAIGGVVGAGFLVKEAVEEPQQRATVPFDRPEEDVIDGTTLIFGTKEKADPSRGALWMVLLSVDPETDEASIVYIPAHTAVEVPGRGLQGVGESYGSGGVPLLLVSAENLLGIKIDRYLELSDKDALVLFEQLDTLTVDVPAEVRVPAGRDQARLIFVEGPQQTTPSSLVKLLYTIGIDGDDVELGSRHLAFWDQLLDHYDNPAELAEAFEAAGAALGESDVSQKELASFIELLAQTPSEDVTITALPVRPISAGDSQLYSTDAEELAAFIDDTIGTREGAEEEVRVQLLNGNGVPGIGREAAAKLVGEGFRVILGGNARRLDYRKTLVIAYDSSDHGIGLAERARDLLGVGEVQVSAQEQGIVDLTIVVGKDFLRAR